MELEDGKKAVEYARHVITKHVKNETISAKLEGKVFEKRQGVFVTINTYPAMRLRGCIGIPQPIMPLKEALKEAAISVCHDPRFPDLNEKELDSIVVEVSILTEPKLINVKKKREYPDKIKIGKDGLIIEKGLYRGLLLPQVATEYNWNSIEFLDETCMKAGLPPACWLDEGTKVYKFQAEIFEEVEPMGRIIKKDEFNKDG